MVWEHGVIVLVAISAGAVVGTAIASFLVALDIIPRLVQLTASQGHSLLYEMMLVLGITSFSLLYLNVIHFNFGNILAAIVGIYMGIFIGMLAAALAEVLNVIPILTKRLGLEKGIFYVMLSIALGKVIGSLIYWLFPVIYQ